MAQVKQSPPVIYAFRRSIWSWYDSVAITIWTRRIPNHTCMKLFQLATPVVEFKGYLMSIIHVNLKSILNSFIAAQLCVFKSLGPKSDGYKIKTDRQRSMLLSIYLVLNYKGTYVETAKSMSLWCSHNLVNQAYQKRNSVLTELNLIRLLLRRTKKKGSYIPKVGKKI